MQRLCLIEPCSGWWYQYLRVPSNSPMIIWLQAFLERASSWGILRLVSLYIPAHPGDESSSSPSSSSQWVILRNIEAGVTLYSRSSERWWITWMKLNYCLARHLMSRLCPPHYMTRDRAAWRVSRVCVWWQGTRASVKLDTSHRINFEYRASDASQASHASHIKTESRGVSEHRRFWNQESAWCMGLDYGAWLIWK